MSYISLAFIWLKCRLVSSGVQITKHKLKSLLKISFIYNRTLCWNRNTCFLRAVRFSSIWFSMNFLVFGWWKAMNATLFFYLWSSAFVFPKRAGQPCVKNSCTPTRNTRKCWMSSIVSFGRCSGFFVVFTRETHGVVFLWCQATYVAGTVRLHGLMVKSSGERHICSERNVPRCAVWNRAALCCSEETWLKRMLNAGSSGELCVCVCVSVWFATRSRWKRSEHSWIDSKTHHFQHSLFLLTCSQTRETG